MAFDAFYLTAVLAEIRQKTIGGRVEKIHQPSRHTVILHLRCPGGREKLLISASPTSARLHLTSASPENPDKPPMFCMMLRKHLSGARLTGLSQLPLERAVRFFFDCTDEMGDPVEKCLTVEMMGRTCNIYLLNHEGRIIDCLRRVGLDESARPALPGLLYQPPRPVEKRSPAEMDEDDFYALLTSAGADLIAQRLMDNLGGLSAAVCREAARCAAGDIDARVTHCDPRAASQKLFLFFQTYLTCPAPYYCAAPDGAVTQFAFCPLGQYGANQRAPSFSSLLDDFYTCRDRRDAMRQKSQTVRKTTTNLVGRLDRKLAVQEKELAATYDRERLRQLGDIVTANLHRIRRGQTVLQAEDFYDADMKTVEIPLSPQLSPQQNAGKFYKDYARLKTAQKELTVQMALARQERAYLQSVLEALSRVQTEQELEEIRQELWDGGYLRPEDRRKKPRAAALPPMSFTSTDGYRIYVGKNNRQNDALTFRTARKSNLWLHAQGVPGSHVIIDCDGDSAPDDTVTQAAQLAAYYSESRDGRNVPVDVTPVREVKKIPGGRLGMVIYHTYRTVIVNPYPDITVDPLNAS